MLGQGGSAIVCLAQDLRHSRPVAIKVLRPEIAMLIGKDRFLEEIETVARLQHPLILPLYDSGEADGLLYFVMPYVQGDSLRDRLEREKQLPVEDALAITRDVATALAFAHERGVVHRDIKPENIMLFGGSAVVADFGIARVLHAAGDPRKTDAGLALGTPLYMSPEQSAASGDVDARSDQYSLACVLYEMLGGTPPFTGLSPADVLAHHVHERARPISELRSTVPPAMTIAVAKALSKLPADRYHTVAEFSDSVLASPRGPRGARPGDRRRRLAAAGTLVVVIAGLLVLRSHGPRLDPRLYFVPPFTHQDTLAPRLLSADNSARYLRESLERWVGLHAVDGLHTADLLLRSGQDRSLEAAIRQARMIGAGRLVLGTTAMQDSFVVVRASVYDVSRPAGSAIEKTVRIRPHPSPEQLEARFTDLAESLVTAGRKTPTSERAIFQTRSIDALLALVAADSALYTWNLARADSGFRLARDMDPQYAYAWLRVAQVGQWRGMAPGSYAADADRALALAAHLSSADSAHAAALSAMAAGRYPNACGAYRDLTRRAPDDLFAWFGLGDCLARDRVVVRDRASPSGWRYRSSYGEAIRAFMRALRSAPSVYRMWEGPAFDRLSRMLYAAPDRILGGRPESSDTGAFGAFPGLDHDTLAFVPYPLASVLAGSAGNDPSRMADAIARNRDTLLALTATWVDAFGTSAEAWAGRASALETSGFVMDRPTGGLSALDAVRRAKGLHPSAELRRALDAAEVRLLLKRGDFAAAADAADRVAGEDDRVPSATRAAVLALRGRIDASANVLGGAYPDTALLDSGRPILLAGDVRRQAGRLVAFAAFEQPAESVRALARQLPLTAAGYFPSPQRAAATWAVLREPLGIAYDELKDVVRARGSAGGDYVLAWRQRLAAGDTAGVRGALRAQIVRRERVEILPGEVDIEATFNEARIALLVGDTAWAATHLDHSLAALPKLNPHSLERVPSAAALVRAMALRAELAARSGDSATARFMARAVAILWRGADPALGPVLERMQNLSSGTH